MEEIANGVGSTVVDSVLDGSACESPGPCINTKTFTSRFLGISYEAPRNHDT